MRIIGGAVLAVHGLIHLMGVALLWRWAQPGELSYSDVHPAPASKAGYAVGGLWALAGLLFVAAAALVLTGRAAWRPLAVAAAICSVPALTLSASVAWAGLVVDAAVLATVVIASRGREVPR